MTHTTPLSTIVFQKPDGTSGELDVHDNEAIHDEASSVKETNIANGAVTTDKIANNAVTTTKIANGAVDTINVADGAITKDKLDNEITEYWDSQSQTKILWSGTSANTDTIRIDVPGINGYKIIGIRLHNDKYPIVQCVIEADSTFEGYAVYHDNDTFRFVVAKGRLEQDAIVITEHRYDSYAVPALGGYPARNAGDWLAVVEILGIS